jgi:hypothetical protein
MVARKGIKLLLSKVTCTYLSAFSVGITEAKTLTPNSQTTHAKL